MKAARMVLLHLRRMVPGITISSRRVRAFSWMPNGVVPHFREMLYDQAQLVQLLS